MIQRLPKVNVLGIVAMCATFVVSALLVRLFVPQVKPFCGMDVIPSRLTSIPPGLIRYQADAPIKFIGIDEKAPGLALIAKNVSGRPITGYTLASNINNSRGITGVSQFTASTDFPISLAVDADYSWMLSPENLKEVWVDFVEFPDGTVWGPDTTRTVERLNARRIGTRQAAQKYSWVLRTRGPQAMLASIPEPITNTQIEGYDPRWRSDFDSAVEEVCRRLLQDKADVDYLAKSKSSEEHNAALTERFNRTLSSYINFRRR